MKSFIKLSCLSALAAAVIAATAQATPINGSIAISGGANFDTTTLSTATKITSFTSATVSSDGGPGSAFTGTFGDTVNYQAFSFNPSSAPISNLWSFTDVGTGWTYSLDLASMSIVTQNDTDLILNGIGTLNIVGAGSPYIPTNGSWRFSVNDSSGGTSNPPTYNFGFTASDASPIPDAGATGLLLGLGVVSIGFATKRSLRKKA